MTYLDIARKRMANVNSSSPLDILIEGGVGSISLIDFYTGDQYLGILVEDKSSDFVDEKVLYVESETLEEGDIVTWKGMDWILFQQEHSTVDSYDKFYILECSFKVKFLVDGYNSAAHPISFLKTSQGMKATRAASRYIYAEGNSSITLLMSNNEETQSLEVGRELIISDTVWEVETVNKYESSSIIVLGLNKDLVSNSDDFNDGVADTINRISGTTYNDGTYEYIIVGDPTIKINSYKTYKAVKIDGNGNRLEIEGLTFTTLSSKVVLTQEGNGVKVETNTELGSFTLETSINGNSITANIEIVDLWG